jgi:hypothetical protein
MPVAGSFKSRLVASRPANRGGKFLDKHKIRWQFINNLSYKLNKCKDNKYFNVDFYLIILYIKMQFLLYRNTI